MKKIFLLLLLMPFGIFAQGSINPPPPEENAGPPPPPGLPGNIDNQLAIFMVMLLIGVSVFIYLKRFNKAN